MRIAACIYVCVGVSEHVVMSMCVTHIRMMCKWVFTVACVSLERVYESRLYTSAHGRCVAGLGVRCTGRHGAGLGALLLLLSGGPHPPDS